MLFSINARIKNKKKKTVVMIYHCHGHFKKVSGYQYYSFKITFTILICFHKGFYSITLKRQDYA